MPKTLKHMSIEEFSNDLAGVVAEVLREQQAVVIETEAGELVALTPVSPSTLSTKTAEDWEAFRAAAGSWADVDIDKFLKDIYESRRSSRPPVSL
jgi:hypothetical protein